MSRELRFLVRKKLHTPNFLLQALVLLSLPSAARSERPRIQASDADALQDDGGEAPAESDEVQGACEGWCLICNFENYAAHEGPEDAPLRGVVWISRKFQGRNSFIDWDLAQLGAGTATAAAFAGAGVLAAVAVPVAAPVAIAGGLWAGYSYMKYRKKVQARGCNEQEVIYYKRFNGKAEQAAGLPLNGFRKVSFNPYFMAYTDMNVGKQYKGSGGQTISSTGVDLADACWTAFLKNTKVAQRVSENNAILGCLQAKDICGPTAKSYDHKDVHSWKSKSAYGLLSSAEDRCFDFSSTVVKDKEYVKREAKQAREARKAAAEARKAAAGNGSEAKEAPAPQRRW